MTTDQFQQMADLLPGGAVLLSAEGKILAASRAVEEHWQLDPEALVGQPLSRLMSTPAAEIETFLRVCLGGEQTIPLQVSLAASGQVLSCRGRRLGPPASGEALQILLTGESGESMSGKILSAVDEVDLRDRLLGLLVHDFRNGLASVPMGLDVLEIEHGKSETVALLRRQIDQLVILVDEVLDISRLLRGKLVLRPEPVVVQEIVQEVASKVAPSLEKRNLQLELKLPAEAISVVADPQRLLQAVTILVLQRSKNFRPGGKLTFSLTRESGEAILCMKDEGQSIHPSMLPHVFDLLTQLQYAGKENHTQLELGLALAGGLIALHGGRIHAQPLATPPGMETFIHLPL